MEITPLVLAVLFGTFLGNLAFTAFMSFFVLVMGDGDDDGE